MVDIVVPGAPVAKPRAKGFYNKKTEKMHHYYKNDKELKSFEQFIKVKASELFEKPMQGPICLSVHFLMPRPQNLMWKTKPMPRTPNIHRSDLDNCVKTVTDALNCIAYLDDAQITELHAWKDYHAGDEGPMTVIRIERAEQYASETQ
jgi:Holliday junction resolvase RusA-like endonuclease